MPVCWKSLKSDGKHLKKKLEQGWQAEVDLSAYNTLAIPAIAERFIEVSSVEDLRLGITEFSNAGFEVPLLLGCGSNVVLTQSRYPAVLHLTMRGLDMLGDGHVCVAAGERWHDFVMSTLQQNYYGLENLALIPGSCGAAPIQNIGAYGVELGEFVTSLTAVHKHNGKCEKFSADACRFGYRDSFFKSPEGRQWVIVCLELQLQTKPCLNLKYPELARAWLEQDKWLTKDELAISNEPRRLAAVVAAIRRRKLPDPTVTPNVGSFFKNPVVDGAKFAELEARWPGVVGFPLSDGNVKVAAGWLIDRAGYKGYMADGIGLHERQALVLINPGKNSGEQVLAFAQRIQEDMATRFDLSLEIEPDLH